MFSFWNKLGWVQYLVEAVLIILSLVMCLYGIKIYKVSLGIIGFLAGGLLSYIFLSLFINADPDAEWYIWVVIGVSVL